MNILLIGGDSSLRRLVIDKLNKEGHRIFLLTEEGKKAQGQKKVFETYAFAYDSECIGEVFESISPDVTVFMGAYDTNFRWSKIRRTPISFTSGLMNVLMAFSVQKRGRLIYLSSEEVFGQDMTGEVTEGMKPCARSPKGMAVAMGEEMCMDYRHMCRCDIVVLRIGYLYGRPKDKSDLSDLCTAMCMEALLTGEVRGSAARHAALLHQSDAVEYIYRIMAAGEHAHSLYHISSMEPVSTLKIAEMIGTEFGKRAAVVECELQGTDLPVLSNRLFDEEFGIRLFKKPEAEIPEIAAYMCRRPSLFLKEDRPVNAAGRFRQIFRALFVTLVPFLENLICFIPFFMLNNRAVGSEYFNKLDFYLLYVLLFAIVYGQQQATFSSLLAVLGYCFRQMYHRSGFDVMLDYNTYVWIAQLLILGLVVGYMRDQLRTVRENKVHELDYMSKQLDHLYDINGSNVRVKEILSDQIINQNDSFGKIYEITSSLDKYEPEEVLFYAAEVLSSLMESGDVAIYTVANRSYARLFSATSAQARSLGNSINYPEMTDMYERLKEKKVYINKHMEEAYPLMAAAIFSEDEMQLILMIWGIPWERMTLGQANRLTVIGYLIQNAVVRANRYLGALEQQRYIKGTSILEESAFASLVRAFLNAAGKGLTECTVLLVLTGGTAQEDASRILTGKMRQSDYLGRLSDGKLYALLSNTRQEDAEYVRTRFLEAGFESRIQEELCL